VNQRSITTRVGLLAGLFMLCGASLAQTQNETRLLRQPAISKDHLAFVYAGDIWIANRDGQAPRRLTTHPADEFAPAFSPDGKWLAFSARYDGNTDVYVVPVEGGQPRRLTWHPGVDTVTGWSVDGKRVLFGSPRELANGRSNQLFEVAVEGGFEKKVMEAPAVEGVWSPDGKQIAYRPYRTAHSGASGWRLHRGGSTPPIWIIDPVSNQWSAIPHGNFNDTNPMWVGRNVVFISDRDNRAANLHLYDTQTKQVRKLTQETTWDVRNAKAFGNAVVYEVGGQLRELAVDTGASRAIPVRLDVQAIQARPQWKDVTQAFSSARLSTTGKRVLLSARGEVFTVPVKDGSVRNLTATSGVRERDALWSQDGKRVAYISDEGRKHSIVLRDQGGLDKPRVIPLAGTSYYYLLAWTPDGKTLVYQDNHLNLYTMDVEKGASKKIDNRNRRGPTSVSVSQDSRWLAYTVAAPNLLNQVRIHDLTTGKTVTVTDGLAHTDNPTFAGSDHLYFTASINTGPAIVGLDMSSQERPLREGIFAFVLAANGKSPMSPRTGDEEDKPEAKDATKPGESKDVKDAPAGAAADAVKDAAKPAPSAASKAPKPVRIDFEGLSARVVALPVPERNYDSLTVASDGALFYLDRRQPGASNEPPEAESSGSADLTRFNFEDRKPKMIKAGVNGLTISPDGKKLLLLYNRGRMEIADANEKLDAKPVELAQVGAVVDPREEWRQIFEETWWMEKEFFYDGGMHGLDWDAVYKRYVALLPHVQRREDLNDLLVDMIAELQVGHNRVGGGDVHRERPSNTGLLGADFAMENGRYRIKKRYAADLWDPFMRGPLAAAGVDVKDGDYLLAVNGQPLTAGKNLYAHLENTVGRQVTLTVADDAQGKGSRNVVVQPIASEFSLRQWDWVERNRQQVEKATAGRAAYVYLPDTGGNGYRFFNRMFFAQAEKDAIIVDDRRNGGGQAANYVTDVLARVQLAGWKDRAGYVYETPGGAIYGPKVMLIDQDAGSGGDFLPYSFKRMGLGPLIGKRTWGGLIGIAANPPLIDGGNLVVPNFRFFTPEREWRIENEGVAPDMDVELDPGLFNQGRDTQLEAAIANIMERLKTNPPKQRKVPPPMPTQVGK